MVYTLKEHAGGLFTKSRCLQNLILVLGWYFLRLPSAALSFAHVNISNFEKIFNPEVVSSIVVSKLFACCGFLIMC